jgi:hypothetical protein
MAASLLLSTAVSAQVSNDAVRIGVLTDMNGNLASLSGKGSVVAATMAVEDFGGKVLDKKIEIVSADHQNKADIGAQIANQWIDVEGVDMIIDVPNSSAGNRQAKEPRVHRLCCGHGGAHRQSLLANGHPLDLGHLRRRRKHGQGNCR